MRGGDEAAPTENPMYTYSSDDHSGTASTISEIAREHGLHARTAKQLAAAFRRAGGYITVTRAGATVVHVAQ